MLDKIMMNEDYKTMQYLFPKISIITVAYNSVNTIEQTIQSVVQQTYDNIEYIIIDGGSTDRTVDVIEKYKHSIAHWVSEKDNGIYDAMNKGIIRSTGDVICFINSDDYLCTNDVIERIACLFRQNPETPIIYGTVIGIVDDDKTFAIQLGRKISLTSLKQGNMIPHQGVFMRKKVFDTLGLFQCEYRLSADYDMVIKSFLYGYSFMFIPEPIAYFRLSGVSSDVVLGRLLISERRKIIKENFDTTTYVMFLIRSQFELFKGLVKKIFIAYGAAKYWRMLQKIKSRM